MTRHVVCPNCDTKIRLNEHYSKLICDKCGRVEGQQGITFIPFGQGLDLCSDCHSKLDLIKFAKPKN